MPVVVFKTEQTFCSHFGQDFLVVPSVALAALLVCLVDHSLELGLLESGRHINSNYHELLGEEHDVGFCFVEVRQKVSVCTNESILTVDPLPVKCIQHWRLTRLSLTRWHYTHFLLDLMQLIEPQTLTCFRTDKD